MIVKNKSVFDAGRVFIFLFSLLLIIQFVLAMMASTVNLSIDYIKQIFVWKQLIVLCFTPIAAIVFLQSVKMNNIDKWALLFFLMIFVTALRTRGDIRAILYGMKFYMNPVLLYFIGRGIAFSKFEKDFNLILVVLSIVIIASAILFEFISDEVLTDMNVRNIYSARGDDVEQGYLLIKSCYFHYRDHSLMRRAFGMFLDPLTLAFFCVPMVYWFRYKEKTLADNVLYICIIGVVLISFTRAIIGAIFIGFFLTGVRKGRYFARTKLMIVLLIVVFCAIGYFIKYLLGVVDPSTWGHLSAYYNLIGTLIHHPLGIGFFRNAETKIDIGFHSTESIYLAMALEGGIIFLIVFLLFAFSLHKILVEKASNRLLYTVHSSLITYFLASLTTEHWFAISSCPIFWLLAGCAVTQIQENENNYTNTITKAMKST